MILDEEGSSPLLETYFLCYSSFPAPRSTAGAVAELGTGERTATLPLPAHWWQMWLYPTWGNLSYVSVIPASGCALVGLFFGW